MKKFYLLCIYLIFNVTCKSQLGLSEEFETMTINQPPTGDWLSSNFTVTASPHGYIGMGNRQALSCHLNYGVQNDSVFTPLLTGCNYGTCGYTFYYRICNWLGNTITSPVNLSNGDTCSVSFYKYTGSNLTSIIPVHKIHSGTHNPDTNFTFWPTYLFPNISYLDTFRIAIHIKKGVLGSYWYDFDRFSAQVFTSINKNNNQHQINIYPNPAKNEISFKLYTPVRNIQIIDIYGKSIKFSEESDQDKHQIHLNSLLVPGIYLISIKTDMGIINSKFLKE